MQRAPENLAVEFLEAWISRFWSPVPRIWPTPTSVKDEICALPQWQVLVDGGLPRINRFRNQRPDHFLASLLHRIGEMVQERWTTDLVKASERRGELVTLPELEHAFLEATGNLSLYTDPANVLETIYGAANMYRVQPAIYASVFGQVERHVLDTVLGRILSEEELDAAIPHIPNTPAVLYSRKVITVRYLMQMEQLKPRGVEWAERIRRARLA